LKSSKVTVFTGVNSKTVNLKQGELLFELEGGPKYFALVG
jgi:hypothetical protein